MSHLVRLVVSPLHQHTRQEATNGIEYSVVLRVRTDVIFNVESEARGGRFTILHTFTILHEVSI